MSEYFVRTLQSSTEGALDSYFLPLLISVIGDMNFGQKLRQLRIQKGLTQQQLAERLGYKTNSYISDVESGHFIPSREKLKKIARALGVPFKVLDDMLFESRLEALGIKEPELISLFKDIPNLPEKDKKAIINAYLKIKEKRIKRKS